MTWSPGLPLRRAQAPTRILVLITAQIPSTVESMSRTRSIALPAQNDAVLSLALLLVLFVATTDEIHQGFAPTRGGSPWDVALDVSGGLASIFLFLVYRRISRGDAAPPPQG